MGQARQRGTYQQRVAMAIERNNRTKPVVVQVAKKSASWLSTILMFLMAALVKK